MNVHHKCQDKVANLCGINQKLLAEALTQVSQVSSRSQPHILYGLNTTSAHIYTDVKTHGSVVLKRCNTS